MTPRIKVYADSPGRFAAQLVSDMVFVLWVLTWAWVGSTVHDRTLELAEPGHRIAASATDLAGSMDDAGGALGDLPVVGDAASAPFEGAAGASRSLAEAGEAEVRAVEQLADWLGLSIALVPILGVALLYLPRRWRFARTATAGRRLADGPADLDLFAWRAVTHQPLHVLAKITDDPIGALRRGDRAVVDALAALELRAAGLPVPRRTPAAEGGAL